MSRWGSSRTTPQAEYSANHGLVFPPLSRRIPTKREMREEKLASIPLDLSGIIIIGNQDVVNSSSAAASSHVVVRDDLSSSSSPQEHNLSSASDDGIFTEEDVAETVVNQERNVSSAAASSHVDVVVPDLSSSSLSSTVDETVVEHNLLASAADDKALGVSTVLDVAETAVVVKTQEGNLVTPCDVTERKEDNLLLPTLAELFQTGNKDWSPADDEKTCPQLKVWSSYRQNRLECFTKLDVAETPLSSGKKGTKVESSLRAANPPAQGSTTTPPLSVSGTANLNNTATHASSSSVDGKLPEPQTTTTTVAPKPDSSSPRADHAGSTTPLSETTTRGSSSSSSSSETVSLALFPPLTGEIQSKKQTRNAHLAP